MADLSPAAQAVLEVAEKQIDLDFRYAAQIAAAVLRAAADQLCDGPSQDHLWEIADELENNG